MDDWKGIAAAVGLGYCGLGILWLLGIFLFRRMGAIEWAGPFNCHTSAVWILLILGCSLVGLSLWAQFQGRNWYSPRM